MVNPGMAIAKLSDSEIEARLGKVEGWSIENGKLNRTFRFADFVDAFGFMTQVALIAERINHHPEWSNVYSTVTIDLVTHECSGLSQRDFDFAEKVNELLEQ